MLVRWTSRRGSTIQKSLAVVLLVSVLVIVLGIFTIPRSLYLQHLPIDGPSGLIPDFHLEEIVKSIPNWTLPELTEPDDDFAEHRLTPDGLLIVNPDAPHPIFQLIRDAEAAWKAKCARASTSLGQAVAEYKRRYRRAPPLGFDKWWEYVVKHNVQLPDEYDEIFEDIEPFWGIDPKELARTQQELEPTLDVVTFEKTGAHPRLEVIHSTLQYPNLEERIDKTLVLFHEFDQDLPRLRFSLSPLDESHYLTDWRIKSMALEAAANGKTLTNADLPPAINDFGWLYACPPDSPARLNPPVLLSPSIPPVLPPPSPKTFITSHRETMNPCVHSWLFTAHGHFLSRPSGEVPEKTLVPLFSLSPTWLNHEIRVPVPYSWDFWAPVHDEGAYEGDLLWERKADKRLDWRGTSTGMHAYSGSYWKYAQRQRLVTLTNALEGNASVLVIPESDEMDPVGEPNVIPLAQVNLAWMDIAFVGKPDKCEPEICEEMKDMWEFKSMQERGEEGQYKFILDIDGNGWSGRFKRLMTGNALIFKATIYPEWFTSRIAPWVHYVPIQVSYSDLYDAVAFFRARDELAAKIAKAGQDWSRRFWRKEDMTAYLYRLLLEYARVSSLDRASMDYVG